MFSLVAPRLFNQSLHIRYSDGGTLRLCGESARWHMRRFGSGMFTALGCTRISSSSTVTPLLRNVGMWLLVDAWLRGFLSTSTVSPLPSPLFATKGDRSDMRLLSIHNPDRLIKPAKTEMLDMEFSPRSSNLRLDSLASGEMSDTELFQSTSSSSWVNPRRYKMLDIRFCPRFRYLNRVNPARGERSDI